MWAISRSGNAAAGLKDLGSAVEQVEEAVKLDPGNGTSQAALGWLKMATGQRDQAETAFKRAIEIEPKSVAAQLALARFYWGVGRIADAEPALKRAVELEPGNAVVQRDLVVARRARDGHQPISKTNVLCGGAAILAVRSNIRPEQVNRL